MYPVAFILMTHRKKILYYKIFKYLRDHFDFYPHRVMSDYERGMRTAISKVWNNAILSGCHFHYKQAIRRKLISYGLKKIIETNIHARNTLKFFMALPLLPQNQIMKGFEEIIDYQRKHSLTRKLISFNKYFVKTWLKNLKSYKLKDHRTNNYAESFNAKLKRKIQKNPSTFMFLSKFILIYFEIGS